MAFLRDTSHVPVAQTVRANDRETQNDAGGFVYAVGDWARLDRFLTIGSEGGTYYAGQSQITGENTLVLEGLLASDGPRVVARVVEISKAGRAAKQDYGLYALALAAASQDGATRRCAYDAIGAVCRTASTLFQFVSYLKGRRGWSRGLRSAIARWYGQHDVDDLAYQFVKYPSRHGYTHRDLLRLAHVDPRDGSETHADAEGDCFYARDALYRWGVGKDAGEAPLPEIVAEVEAIKLHDGAWDPDRMAAVARKVPREALPTEWLTNPAVWEAMLFGEAGRGMPLTALIRNLGNLSKCGLLTAGSNAAAYVCAELTNTERILTSRVHPMSLFLGGATYAMGRGVRGSGEWAPVSAVVDALDRGFDEAFGNVPVTGKRLLVSVDASGSMNAPIMGYQNVSARNASLAFALIVMRTEPNARFIGFTDGSNTTEFKVGGDERLRDFVARFNQRVEGRGTDCAIPFAWAEREGFSPDAVLIWTDSETWAGRCHPDQALASLRRSTRKHVKAAIASTTATGHTVGNPADLDVLQVCGFDASVPQIIADFVGAEPERRA